MALRRLLNLAATCKELHHLVHNDGMLFLARQIPAEAWQAAAVSAFGSADADLMDILRRMAQNPDCCKLSELQVGIFFMQYRSPKESLFFFLYDVLRVTLKVDH